MVVEINWPQLKKTTMVYLGLLMAGSLTAQLDWTKTHIIPLLANHPKLSPVGGFLLAGLALLHNPEVPSILREFRTMVTVRRPDGGVETKKTVSTEKTTEPQAIDG